MDIKIREVSDQPAKRLVPRRAYITKDSLLVKKSREIKLKYIRITRKQFTVRFIVPVCRTQLNFGTPNCFNTRTATSTTIKMAVTVTHQYELEN